MWEGRHVKSNNITKPDIDGEQLLTMPPREATQLFQSYTHEQQLQIIESTRDPRKREELYYLAPDGTALIQDSSPGDLLQIMQTMLGTGLACGILGAVSGEQLEEMIDLSVWKDGKLDQEAISLWLIELAECDEDDLVRLLPEIDLRILVEVIRDRIDLKSDYKGLFVESGLVGLESLEYDDEQVRLVMEMLWAADEDIFMSVLRILFTEPEPGAEEYEGLEHELRLEAAQSERDERIRKRDREAGLAVAEEELFEEVDLDNLPLKREDEKKDD